MGDVYWGIFREEAHSPGRESDDSEILRLTAKGLEAKGFQVDLKTPDELGGAADDAPRGIFLMCERTEALEALRALEAEGVLHVNTPAGVLNTYRRRMIAQFAESGVSFVPSLLVATTGERVEVPEPMAPSASEPSCLSCERDRVPEIWGSRADQAWGRASREARRLASAWRIAGSFFNAS